MSHPASPAALTTSIPRGPGRIHGIEAERPPYLSALNQQVLEGRPELSTEDPLQLPGQHLSWFPGALSRKEAGAGLRGHPETTSTGHLPSVGSRPAPRSHRQGRVWQLACLGAGVTLPRARCPRQRVTGAGVSQAKGTTSEGCTRAPGSLSGPHKVTSALPSTTLPTSRRACFHRLLSSDATSHLCSPRLGSRPLPMPPALGTRILHCPALAHLGDPVCY